MTALTDGLITEADRLLVVNLLFERGTRANSHALIGLALKMGVTPETLKLAAQSHDDVELMETDISAQVRGYLSECG